MRRATSLSTGPLLIAAGIGLMSAAAASEPSQSLNGEWGGPQVRLIVTDDGSKLELGCAAASLDAPLRPDASGNFATTGKYEAFTGGPALADASPATNLAHFTGHVEGTTMHLSVHQAGAKIADKYTLERGRRVKLIRCV